jgi:hypothetical protein
LCFYTEIFSVGCAMKIKAWQLGLAGLGVSVSMALAGQTLPLGSEPSSIRFPSSPTPPVRLEPTAAQPEAEDSSAISLLRGFKDSDVKFDLQELMDVLRDRRHEGWVLAAYPDPKTGRPLIGAGFSLDLSARDHPQLDSLNPHPFLEPSSDELWRASGLQPGLLQSILEQFSERARIWSKKRFRQNIRTLTPQITDAEATLLLRVAAIQAIFNAKAYCRDFDQMSASQQMAVSQLVYQLGVNLEEFSQFLTLINSHPEGNEPAAETPEHATAAAEKMHWELVQRSLTQSQWARLYRGRATTVIAMLDPDYAVSPGAAEHRVSAYLRPVVHRRTRRSKPLEEISTRNPGVKAKPGGKRAHTRLKRSA